MTEGQRNGHKSEVEKKTKKKAKQKSNQKMEELNKSLGGNVMVGPSPLRQTTSPNVPIFFPCPYPPIRVEAVEKASNSRCQPC